MDNGKIVVLEGTSCTGKTTLCESLKAEGWIVLPEAIRYLEKETGKKGDEASPVPNLQAEEEYYQDELFRVELHRIQEANFLRSRGKNVVMDKSFLAVVATAKAFEEQMGFVGTFKRAYLKYCNLLQELQQNGLVECDVCILLQADYDTICKRNTLRNHVLDGVWLDANTIEAQREVLEKMVSRVVGSGGKRKVKKSILDTSDLSKEDVLEAFHLAVSSPEEVLKRELERE